MRRILMICVLVGVLPSLARAEPVTKYAPIVVDPDFPGVFALLGTIDGRTALNFERAMDEYGRPDVLLLSSGGGLVGQALLIARRVREIGADTHISEGDRCFSACAYIFLAGTVRNAEGDLGLHQISSDNADLVSGQMSVSDIIDTLSDFDVPNDLMVEMFRTPPDEMYILTDAEKVRYALLAGPSGRGAPDPRAPEPPVVTPGRSAERAAFDFLAAFFAAWSRPNETALERTVAMYGPSVDFYGTRYSKGEVAAEKARFAERWPRRDYRIIGETVAISCDTARCYTQGNYSFRSSSSVIGDESAGVAYFEMILQRLGAGFAIIKEDGRVVERR